jgi:hypothetical protein
MKLAMGDKAHWSGVRTAQKARPGRRCQVRRVPTAGKQHADWFGRPVRGDGEGVEAQAVKAREHDAGGDEQGEKRPVGRFESKTRRSKPIDRHVPEPDHSRRLKRVDVGAGDSVTSARVA